MDGLRWLLLIFGLILIAGVYLYSRRSTKPVDASDSPDERLEPSFGDEPASEAEKNPEPEASLEDADSDHSHAEPLRHEQTIITLRLVALSAKPSPTSSISIPPS